MQFILYSLLFVSDKVETTNSKIKIVEHSVTKIIVKAFIFKEEVLMVDSPTRSMKFHCSVRLPQKESSIVGNLISIL